MAFSHRAFAAAVLWSTLGGCRAAPDPIAGSRFPIGLFDADDPTLENRLREGGFDTLQGHPPPSTDRDHGDATVVWFPEARARPEAVADQLDSARDSAPPGKALWAVLPACDWPPGRFPDRAELRFMSYLAVLHGANGLFYFTLKRGKKTLLDFPELWQAVSGVAQEMKGLQPVFEQGKTITLPFAPADGIEAKAWRYRARDYVVVVNRRQDQTRAFPSALLEPRWRALFEARRDPKDALEPAGTSLRLKPQQVVVLESALL